MPDDFRTLLALTLVFVPLSLLSIGGGASLLADMEHQSVGVHGWTTPREFADLFAISRAAPGPGTMLAALIGWKAAGWAGAVTATVALYLPSSIVVYGAARLWGRWRGSVWHTPSSAVWLQSPPVSCCRAESRYCAFRPAGLRSGPPPSLRRYYCCAGRAFTHWCSSPPAAPCSGWLPYGKTGLADAAKRSI
jgi:hypothetical protein